MDQSENKTSSQKDGSFKVKDSPVIPPFAPGNPDADKYAAEQTAAAAVPTIGDLYDSEEKFPYLWYLYVSLPKPEFPFADYPKAKRKAYTQKSYSDPSLNFEEELRLLKYFLAGKMKAGAQQIIPHRQYWWAETVIPRAKENLLADAVNKVNSPYNPDDLGISLNCQRCALVLYRRLCGEDMYAVPSARIDPYRNLAKLLEVFAVPPEVSIKQFSNAIEFTEWLENHMKEKGEYTVMAIGVYYENIDEMGHMFNVAQLNGKTYYVDAQKQLHDVKGTLDTVNYEKPITIIDLTGATFNEERFQSIGL